MKSIQKLLLAVILIVLVFEIKINRRSIENMDLQNRSGNKSVHVPLDKIMNPIYSDLHEMYDSSSYAGLEFMNRIDTRNVCKTDFQKSESGIVRMNGPDSLDSGIGAQKIQKNFEGLIPIFSTAVDSVADKMHRSGNGRVSRDSEISIVQISLMGEDEDTLNIDYANENMLKTREIKLTDVDTSMHYELVVHSWYSDGSETFQYLPWDSSHPDSYELFGPLGMNARVTVCSNENPLVWFTMDVEDEEIIELSMNTSKVILASMNLVSMYVVAKQ